MSWDSLAALVNERRRANEAAEAAAVAAQAADAAERVAAIRQERAAPPGTEPAAQAAHDLAVAQLGDARGRRCSDGRHARAGPERRPQHA